MMRRNLPATASFAEKHAGGRLHAPSAARNVAPICALLEEHAPVTGAALELASGTGQHVVAFAACRPGLNWQPSDPDPERRASIALHIHDSGLANIAPPVALDAVRRGWSADHSGQALVVLVNLLHLVSLAEARTLVEEAARALEPGGRFLLYGPFRRNGLLTSDGDRAFDAALRKSDPDIGYKDDLAVRGWLGAAGLELLAAVDMPANNLALVSKRAGA